MQYARSAEFTLLLACCRWPRTSTARDRIKRAALTVDWTRFEQLAARHRVEGLVWNALNDTGVSMPLSTKAVLSAAAARIARQNLTLAAQSIKLNVLLKRTGVAVIFVKGVTLGKLAYGDIGRKAGWDIDLVISKADLDKTAAVLEQCGFRLTIPSGERAKASLALWHVHSKESVWQSADGTVWVELHTALTDNPMLLPDLGPAFPRCDVEVSPGMALPTLARDELFAYLCVHGASSAWFRLKWIADLAALISGDPSEEVERLYRRAVKLGAGRSAASALLLAHLLFGSAVRPPLWRELRSDRINRWLVALALRKLTGRAGEVELDQVMLGTASIHFAQFGLLPGWRFKRAELGRQLINPIDRVATPLPAMLSWLYPFFRIARLVLRRSIG